MTTKDAVVVVGAGLMGTGIAHGFVAGAYPVTLVDTLPSALARSRDAIAKILSDGVRLGKSSEADATAALARLQCVPAGHRPASG